MARNSPCTILKIHAREILDDSLGNPTAEVHLYTSKKSLPHWCGIYEALGLCDTDETCYMGKSASKAVEHISKTTVPALVSKKLNSEEQEKIDKPMIGTDGSEN